jgi:hypothetical protein
MASGCGKYAPETQKVSQLEYTDQNGLARLIKNRRLIWIFECREGVNKMARLCSLP